MPALVITTYEPYSIGISNLERQQQQESLNRVESSVNKVTDEEVIRFWTVATNSEQFLQIIELTMNVAAAKRCQQQLIEEATNQAQFEMQCNAIQVIEMKKSKDWNSLEADFLKNLSMAWHIVSESGQQKHREKR